MPISDTFFDTLRDWTKRKIEIISKYTAAGARILKKGWYIDGFAGTGLYEDEKKGSSLVVAEIAQELKDKVSLSCLNVEEDRENYRQLVRNTCQLNPPPINLHGSFTGKIDDILEHISNDNVICFLDPFGIKGIDYSTIQKLVNRNTNENNFATDLWLRFDTKITHRLRGRNPTKTDHFKLLHQAFGINDPYRLLDLLTNCDQCDITENAVRQYLEQLKLIYQEKYGHAYTGYYPIYSLEGDYKYYLTFITKHPIAICVASDVVYSSEKQYKLDFQTYKETATNQLSLFSISEVTEKWMNLEAIKRIKDHLTMNCRRSTMPLLKIKLDLIEHGQFGKFSHRDLRKALLELKEDHFIISSSSNAYSKMDTEFTFIP